MGVNATLPWEFTSLQPVRSWTQVLLTSYPPLYFLKVLSNISSEFEITSKNILLFQRSYMCLISFIVDFCVYKHFSSKNENYLIKKTSFIMMVLASSSIMTVFSCRPFTNTLELLIFSLLFLPFFKLKNLSSIVFYSFISVLGTFIRPTFLIYSLFLYIQRFFIPKKFLNKILFAMKHLLFSSFFITFFILFDSYFFNFLKPLKIVSYLHDNGIKSFLSHNITITPLNFILYNSENQNLAKHGIHSRLTHSLVNVFILFSSLILTAYYNLFNSILNFNIFAQASRILSWLVPLILLSVFPHQEPRFLIPLIIPLVISYARTMKKNKLLVYIWVTANTFSLIFYGFIHQGGLIKAMLHMADDTPSHTSLNIIFWRSYMPPQHLILPSKLPHCQEDGCMMKIITRDLAGASEQDFINEFNTKNLNNTFLYTTGSVLQGDVCEMKGIGRLKLVNRYWPHFSGEDLFLNDPQLQFTFCNQYMEVQEVNEYISFIFGVSLPHFITNFIDKTSFKVFKIDRK